MEKEKDESEHEKDERDTSRLACAAPFSSLVVQVYSCSSISTFSLRMHIVHL